MYLVVGELNNIGQTFMKQYFFPIFIISLGLFTAYVFYALWHTEEVNPSNQVEKPHTIIHENLSNKHVIPKSVFTVPDASLDMNSQLDDEKELQQMTTEQEDAPYLTPEQRKTQTEAVYDALIPEDYEETIQEANEAFVALDAHVEALDAQLAEEMGAMEEMTASEEAEIVEEDVDEMIEENPIEALKREEEISLEEDINNL